MPRLNFITTCKGSFDFNRTNHNKNVSVCRTRVQQVMNCILGIFTVNCLQMTYRAGVFTRRHFQIANKFQNFTSLKGDIHEYFISPDYSWLSAKCQHQESMNSSTPAELQRSKFPNLVKLSEPFERIPRCFYGVTLFSPQGLSVAGAQKLY